MSQTNSVIIHGNLTHEPSLKTFNGRAFCSFQVACSRSWEDQEGQEKTHTDFLPVTAWGKVAESITAQEITKGSLVAIEGNLRSSRYEKDGSSQTCIFVSARDITNVLKNKDSQTPSVVLPPAEEFDPNDLVF